MSVIKGPKRRVLWHGNVETRSVTGKEWQGFLHIEKGPATGAYALFRDSAHLVLSGRPALPVKTDADLRRWQGKDFEFHIRQDDPGFMAIAAGRERGYIGSTLTKAEEERFKSNTVTEQVAQELKGEGIRNTITMWLAITALISVACAGLLWGSVLIFKG